VSIREKKLRVIDINGCEWIPCRLGVFPTAWSKYREKLEELLAKHSRLFPGFKKGSVDFLARVKGKEVLYAFECLWRFNIRGCRSRL
jgi:hypothetical protein